MLKRLLDVLMSIILILFLSPFFLAISLFVKFSSSGPTFYRGTRTGLRGKPFLIYKFRTMVSNAEKIGGFSTALNDHRLTGIGRILRKYKVDEIPQLFNVLKGEMSLVGPRPQVSYYTNLYSTKEKIILSVRPGITDLASLYFSDMDSTLGDSDVDKYYEKNIEPVKNKLRLKYVKEISLLLDLRILIETFFKVIGIAGVTNLRIDPFE
jgi:lipopolysaccharide/colanic/teichoic acid biosynthesis glycosyltransferase